MNDCLFCKIIKGEIPSKTVYEDEIIKVILDVNPATNGHLLILPKKHVENLFDIEEDVLMHSIKIIKERLYPLLKEKLNCEGLTITQNNFLGQEIKHFHIHVIPRYQDDQVEFNYNQDMLISTDEVLKTLLG